MIFDKTLLFADAQAVTAAVASTNSIDFGKMGRAPRHAADLSRDVAKAVEIPLLVQVVEPFNNITSLKVDIEVDATSAFAAPKVISIGTFLLSELKVGFQVPWKLLPQGINQRFAQLKFTPNGTAPTTGKITAGIVDSVQTNGA